MWIHGITDTKWIQNESENVDPRWINDCLFLDMHGFTDGSRSKCINDWHKCWFIVYQMDLIVLATDNKYESRMYQKWAILGYVWISDGSRSDSDQIVQWLTLNVNLSIYQELQIMSDFQKCCENKLFWTCMDLQIYQECIRSKCTNDWH